MAHIAMEPLCCVKFHAKADVSRMASLLLHTDAGRPVAGHVYS